MKSLFLLGLTIVIAPVAIAKISWEEFKEGWKSKESSPNPYTYAAIAQHILYKEGGSARKQDKITVLDSLNDLVVRAGTGPVPKDITDYKNKLRNNHEKPRFSAEEKIVLNLYGRLVEDIGLTLNETVEKLKKAYQQASKNNHKLATLYAKRKADVEKHFSVFIHAVSQRFKHLEDIHGGSFADAPVAGDDIDHKSPVAAGFSSQNNLDNELKERINIAVNEKCSCSDAADDSSDDEDFVITITEGNPNPKDEQKKQMMINISAEESNKASEHGFVCKKKDEDGLEKVFQGPFGESIPAVQLPEELLLPHDFQAIENHYIAVLDPLEEIKNKEKNHPIRLKHWVHPRVVYQAVRLKMAQLIGTDALDQNYFSVLHQNAQTFAKNELLTEKDLEKLDLPAIFYKAGARKISPGIDGQQQTVIALLEAILIVPSKVLDQHPKSKRMGVFQSGGDIKLALGGDQGYENNLFEGENVFLGSTTGNIKLIESDIIAKEEVTISAPKDVFVKNAELKAKTVKLLSTTGKVIIDNVDVDANHMIIEAYEIVWPQKKIKCLRGTQAHRLNIKPKN